MDPITKGLIEHKRSLARRENAKTVKCPVCHEQLRQDLQSFRDHVKADDANHAALAGEAEVVAAFEKMTLTAADNSSASQRGADPVKSPRKRPNSEDKDAAADSTASNIATQPTLGDSLGSNKRRASPPTSVAQTRGSSSPTPRRSHAVPSSAGEFDRGPSFKNPSGRRLWHHDDAKSPSSRSGQGQSRRHGNPSLRHPQSGSHGHGQSSREGEQSESQTSIMLRQPETRPITQEQLVPEVKGIYTGLVMVETKCIEVDSSQSNASSESQLSDEQWQALIALHRTLLQEHHDFFLASQHPSAGPALRRLASKYAMPARMWRHGIHSFLELLRHKLPGSLEHMLTFIYLAYSMIALLYETVPDFKDVWIECLGDLGRYRMAVEDDDIRDRETWAAVSQGWYGMASDKSPTTGRLYHHLAILARPNALQQLFYYTKSLCVPVPFQSARDSIMTLFDPLMNPKSSRQPTIDSVFGKVHGILFSKKSKDQLEPSMQDFLGQLDGHIGRTTKGWLESGYYLGIILACSLLNYGAEAGVLMRILNQSDDETDVAMESAGVPEPDPELDEAFEHALSFAVKIYEIILRRWGDPNILPCLHVTLAFIYHMSRHPAAMARLEAKYPWALTRTMLNYLISSSEGEVRMDTEQLPGSQPKDGSRPLPEDYAMNGLLFTEDYLVKELFQDDHTDRDERTFELPSMTNLRRERILWLGRKIAVHGKWLLWDEAAREFAVPSEYDVDLEDIGMAASQEDDVEAAG